MIGELVLCPRCVGTWIAAGLASSQMIAPRFGRALTWTLGAAAANVLFIISLFFPWYGVASFDFNGEDVIPSWWLMLVFAALAALKR